MKNAFKSLLILSSLSLTSCTIQQQPTTDPSTPCPSCTPCQYSIVSDSTNYLYRYLSSYTFFDFYSISMSEDLAQYNAEHTFTLTPKNYYIIDPINYITDLKVSFTLKPYTKHIEDPHTHVITDYQPTYWTNSHGDKFNIGDTAFELYPLYPNQPFSFSMPLAYSYNDFSFSLNTPNNASTQLLCLPL